MHRQSYEVAHSFRTRFASFQDVFYVTIYYTMNRKDIFDTVAN